MNVRAGGNQTIPRPDHVRPGADPWWLDAGDRVPSLDVMVERIRAFESSSHLRTEEFSQQWVAGARRSAVLVALFDSDDGPCVILTKRANHLRNHRGEISFPGGRVEEGESVREAALREAEEEIALPPGRVRLTGELDALTTFVSNSLIVPVVGTVDAFDPIMLRADPGEVDEVIVVPVSELLRGDTYRNEWWSTPRGDMNIHFFHLDTETIWGATARILRQLIEVTMTGADS